MHKMRISFRLALVGIAFSTMTLLVGCSDAEEAPRDAQTSEAEEAALQEEEANREAQQAEMMEEREPIDVQISVSASMRSDRLMMVEGETNLPDGALVQVVVEREISSVRWRERVNIRQGQFSAGPFGPGSGLPDGGYSVSVELSESSVQPDAVQQLIGPKGEYLAGALVSESRHGLGQIATYTTRYMVGNEPRRSRDGAELLQTP
ncbi:hypothetical protein [Vreelandella arcis]|uniref:Lipoprotein n=1 Tax=Vreelandella arcis TaxID=416873 RepID=A0A1H0JAP4_9GAMM|nr:hypothetical protein [Halomonas arcis]SDO40797.1 hypothetical protein SAMN04487951_12521 [Halomonas arcis]